MPLSRVLLVLVLVLGLGLAACGDEAGEAPSSGGGTGNPVYEAREGNEVTLGGVSYRVTLFRELNVRTEPDSSYYRGPLPEGDELLYAAFVHACNVTDEPQTTAPTMRLLDGFGETFSRLEPEDDNALAYRQRTLEPEECAPRPDSVADGAVVAFGVPLEDVRERPLVLEIPPGPGDEAADPARVELDL